MTTADAIVILSDILLLFVLVIMPIFLTFAMFGTKQMMLGFPCVIFWGILGGYCYNQSAAIWDIYYFVFFASFGMAIFSSVAMYALRTRKEEARIGDDLIDETKVEEQYIDEGKEETPSSRREKVQQRAKDRRSKWR